MNHYFDTTQLKKPLSQDRELPGIDFNTLGQLHFLKNLEYSVELLALKLNEQSGDPTRFSLNNGSFEAGDADYLYQFIRTIKPKKIIEIGSGNSTKIVKIALEKNDAETATPTKHICIEPYEQPWLEKLKNTIVIRKCLEDCDINWTTELQADDLLFIDSSHIIKPQGDVLKEYLEILPALPSAVYVHIHDIFSPKDYLQSLIVHDVRFWNEQYLLEALLCHTQRYEIIGALNFLKHHHYDELKNACPYLTPQREPGSFYVRVR